MLDPHLRKAIWLTRSQRAELLLGAENASKNAKSDSQLCHNVAVELTHLEIRLQSLTTIVHSVVRGLKLPHDALPVYISHAETQQICRYGKISDELKSIINPPLRRSSAR